METLKYSKNSLLVNYTRSAFENEVLKFMSKCNFDEMYVDEDNEVIFYRRSEPFSAKEYRSLSLTSQSWQHIQEMWNEECKNTIEYDFQRCFDIAQRLDSMYPDMPGAFSGTVSERLSRHADRIAKEKEQHV